jgi:hypothetical protein
LTLFINRVALVPWAWENLKYIFPSDNNTIEDQKASFGFSWVFPQAGFEVYGEIGIDDYVPGNQYIRHLFHTNVYTGGLKKKINIIQRWSIYGEITAEFNWMEMTQDFQFQWPYSFYFHHIIIHGYTNKGQTIGVGNGWAGNSQYLGFKLFYPNGFSLLYIYRTNPDNNFLYSQAVEDVAGGGNLSRKLYGTYKASFVFGISTLYYLTKELSISGGFLYDYIINPQYKNDSEGNNITINNFGFQFGVKYVF